MGWLNLYTKNTKAIPFRRWLLCLLFCRFAAVSSQRYPACRQHDTLKHQRGAKRSTYPRITEDERRRHGCECRGDAGYRPLSIADLLRFIERLLFRRRRRMDYV